MHIENYNILLKEIEEYQYKWKVIPWTEWHNTEMVILSQLIYSFSVTPISIPATFPPEIGKLISQFIWKFKGPKRAKTILKYKNQVERFLFPNFKIYSNCSYSDKKKSSVVVTQ